MPEFTADVVGLGALRLVDAMRNAGFDARFYQASSSEMFGALASSERVHAVPSPQPLTAVPRSSLTGSPGTTREASGLHVSNGILFNHESPRRGENFVTRKITRGLA